MQSAIAQAPVVVGLPVPRIDATGRLVLQPNVVGTPFAPPVMPEQPLAETVVPASAELQGEALPPPGTLQWPGGAVDPNAHLPLLNGGASDIWLSGEPLVPWDEIDHGFTRGPSIRSRRRAWRASAANG